MTTGKIIEGQDMEMRKYHYRENELLEMSPTKLKRMQSEYPKSMRSADAKGRKHSLFFASDEAEILASLLPLERKKSVFPSSEYLHPVITHSKSVSSYQLSAMAVAEHLSKV